MIKNPLPSDKPDPSTSTHLDRPTLDVADSCGNIFHRCRSIQTIKSTKNNETYQKPNVGTTDDDICDIKLHHKVLF